MGVLNSASLASASIQKQLRIFRRILLVIILIVAALAAVIGLCSMEDQVTGSGVVTGLREYQLRALADGKVSAVMCRSGEIIPKGGVLVRMDDRLLQLDIAALKEQIRAAECSGAANIASLRRELQKLEIRAGDYQLTAPEDGMAVRIPAWTGGYFRKGDELVKFVAVNPRQVVADIHEKQIRKIRKGQQVRISSPLYNYLDHGYFYGEVAGVEDAPVIRNGEAYYPVRIILDNRGERLRLGSSCKAVIIIGRQRMLYSFFGIKDKNRQK